MRLLHKLHKKKFRFLVYLSKNCTSVEKVLYDKDFEKAN